jgi:hypothetical protein
MIANVVTYLSGREVSGQFGKRTIGYARVVLEGVQTLQARSTNLRKWRRIPLGVLSQ